MREKDMSKISRLLATTAVLSLAVSGSAAFAQSGTESEDGIATGEIIVTAQRRDESLSRTPVAVAIVSSEQLDRAQIKTEGDLRVATPGLAVRAGLTDTQLNFSLRGQSQDPFSDTRPGVLPYFNEVPLAGQGIATALYDLQSVQVLKGPQGTLFGRSATGGAVLYTTARPTDEFGGQVSLTGGSRNYVKAEGSLNIPLVEDKVLLRVAGFYNEKDGFQRNLYDGARVGDRHSEGGRVTLLVKPSDSFRNTLIYDYYHIDGQNTASILAGLLPFTGVGYPFVPLEFLYAGNATPVATITGQCTVQAFVQIPGACPPADAGVAGFYNAYFADSRRTSTGVAGVAAQQRANGPRVVNYNTQNIFNARVHTITNITELDLGENATIKNIFGFQRSIAETAIDVDASPFGIQNYDILNQGQINNGRQFSNELQIVGKAFDGKLNYVVGLFFADERLHYDTHLQFFDILFGGQLDAYDHDLTSKTYAAFAQGTYALNDTGLSVTGGLRYTSEKTGVIIDPVKDIGRGRFCSTPGYDCTQSTTFKNLSWTLGIQNQFTPELLAYIVSRRSYKSGGYNSFVAPKIGGAAVGGNFYGDERATDIEGGLKFAGRVGDMPLRTNIAAYYVDTRNSQRAAYIFLGGPGSANVNVPKQRTYGIEFDAELRPSDWLSIGGTFNYTNAVYTNGQVLVPALDATGNQIAIPQLFDRVPDTPRTSGSVFADITVPVSSSVNFLLHGDLFFQSKSFTNARSGNFSGTTISSYQLANFRVGIEDKDAGWALSVNVKNAFDKDFYVGGFATGEIYQVNTLVPGEPRQVLAEVRYKF
jgi:iron complex outermembrane recepter protein